ncbi:MAG: ArsR/SmtB family transcription factor [Desulfovibrionaceae bacterium]
MSHPISLFKALADETRLRLYHILTRHELNVNELTAIMGMGQSRVSRHLKILADCGLVAPRRDGLWVFYAVRAGSDEPAAAFAACLDGLLAPHPEYAADLARARRAIEDRTRATTRFFNEVAGDWESMAKEILGGFDLPAAIAARVPACATVADLGCGTGDVLAALEPCAGQRIGVDGSQKMLDRARDRFGAASGLSLRIGELEHLPLRDAEADTVVMSMVLHHLSDPATGLREAYRVVRPGGAFVLADFDKHASEALRTRHGDHWLGFTEQELLAWLREAGFDIRASDAVSLDSGLRIRLVTAHKP